MIFDEKGNIVREPAAGSGSDPRRQSAGAVQAAELKPGQERKEIEGVFVVRDGKAVFEQVKTGIAGEKYFEVLSGLKDGDAVIVGPFSSVRQLRDGAAVKVEAAPRGPTAAPAQ
jgi:HlyD family secretion protein